MEFNEVNFIGHWVYYFLFSSENKKLNENINKTEKKHTYGLFISMTVYCRRYSFIMYKSGNKNIFKKIIYFN